MSSSIVKLEKKETVKGCNSGLGSLLRPETQSKFKTEFCRNLEAGFCEFGDKCFFAHSIEELRDRSYIGALKVMKCKDFFELGYCINGHNCQSRHREISPDTATNSPDESKKTSRKGSEDTHKHPIFIDLECRSFF